MAPNRVVSQHTTKEAMNNRLFYAAAIIPCPPDPGHVVRDEQRMIAFAFLLFVSFAMPYPDCANHLLISQLYDHNQRICPRLPRSVRCRPFGF
jgi:hypothetical protein